MDKRFSTGRVLAGTGAILRARWPGLILITLLFGVAGPLVLAQLADAMGLMGRGAYRVGAPGPKLVLWSLSLAVNAAWGAGLIALALGRRGGPGGGGHSGAVWRTALVSLPAVMLVHIVLSLPGIASALALEGMRVAQPQDGTNTLSLMTVSLVSMVGGLGNLVVTAFLGMAPAVVVHEGRSPVAALGRALRLSRRRRWLLLGLEFGLAMLVGLAHYVMVFTAAARQDPALTSWVGAYGSLVFSPVQTLLLAFWAAAFLELRRLVDPPLEDTAGVFE